MQRANGVSTPGVDEGADAEGSEPKEFGQREATLFRGMAASCNYLIIDRPDIMFPVKEICREMSKPTELSINRLKRVGRYLKAHPRLIWHYPWQADGDTVDVHTDSNWAACRITR